MSIFAIVLQNCRKTLQKVFSQRLYMYVYNKGWVKSYPLRPVRHYSNLVMPQDMVGDLIDTIHMFLYSETIRNFIRKFDMPLKKTIRIEGVDGSSKMELVHMLATTYNKDIYDFSEITNFDDLRHAMKLVRDRRGFLLCHGDFKMTVLQRKFCKLLSEIDWKHPMVCFLVNDFNSQKSKYLPDQGVDYNVYIPCLDIQQIRQIYRHMIGGDDYEEEELVVQKLLTSHTNVGEVRQWLIQVAHKIIGRKESISDLLDDFSNLNRGS